MNIYKRLFATLITVFLLLAGSLRLNAASENLYSEPQCESVETVNAYVDGTTARIVLDQSTPQQLLDKLDFVSSAAAKMSDGQQVCEGKIEHDAVITIKALYDSQINKLDIQLPVWFLTAAKEKKIDRIAVESGFANIAAAPGAIETTGFEDMTLSIHEQENTESLNAFNLPLKSVALYSLQALTGNLEVEEFAAPVQVTLPYASGSQGEVAVFYVNKDWEFEKMPCSFDSNANKVDFSALYPGKYVIGVHRRSE